VNLSRGGDYSYRGVVTNGMCQINEKLIVYVRLCILTYFCARCEHAGGAGLPTTGQRDCGHAFPIASNAHVEYRNVSIFSINLVRRLCGLQSGSLDRPVYSVKLSREARSWPMDALLLTSALTQSYANDQPMEVDFSHVRSFRDQLTRCRLKHGCMFDGAIFSTPAPASSKSHTWDSQKLQAHYLRGAGILWLRDRTISNTGCDLAATMLTFLLQPSEELQAVMDKLSAQLASTGRPTVILNTDSTHMSEENLDAVLRSNINGTVWVMGGSTAGTRTLAQRHPHAQILELSLPEELPAESASAIMAMMLSFSSHYIGDLDAAWVKIGLLLRLGRYHALPSLSVGDSQWKDDYGFASCTSEEFRVHQKVVSGIELLYRRGCTALAPTGLCTCMLAHTPFGDVLARLPDLLRWCISWFLTEQQNIRRLNCACLTPLDAVAPQCLLTAGRGYRQASDRRTARIATSACAS
jgi:hypothetical protein